MKRLPSENSGYCHFKAFAKYGSLLMLIFILGCSYPKLKQAKNTIRQFEDDQIADKREVVFHVEAVKEGNHVLVKGETSDPGLKNDLVQHLSAYNIRDQISVLPDQSLGTKNWGLVNVSVASLRAEPKHSSELITQATMGTPVRIFKKSQNWFMIQTPDRYISWVESQEIAPLSAAELDSWKKTTRMIFTGDFDLLYQDTIADKPAADIITASIVEFENHDGPWLKVRLPDGRIAFSNSEEWKDLEMLFQSVKVDQSDLINTAIHFTGRPYLWGGTSAKAMDCSGYTKTVYFLQGLILARDASQQIKYGNPVEPGKDFKNLQPGDLLFFAGTGNPDKITHVAISLGETEYIHASGMVKQNSFDPQHPLYSKYRHETFVAAKRIAGMENAPGIIPVNIHPWYKKTGNE